MNDRQTPSSPPSEDPPTDDLSVTASHLNSGAIHLLRGLRIVDREAGLTPARLSALSVLVFGGPRSLGRLAEAEDVAGPTMTRIVDGLVDLGLAQRVAHPENGRMTTILATDAGMTLMHDAAQKRIDAIVAALGTLSDQDRGRIQEAAPALRRLAMILRNDILTPGAHISEQAGTIDS
ncbi:MAG TPA: MarR family transcriptional regulator [Thermomicrobiales bacterium]|nr:MarR family transcriptional regulator [Thermomicrobiales bacterium]